MSNKVKNFLKLFWKYIFRISIGLNILVALFLIGAVLAWYVAPSKIIAFSFLGLAFGAILFVNFLFVLLWIFARKWKCLGIQVLFLICCYVPITTYFPISFSTPEDEISSDSFKILSYNIRSFNWWTGDKAKNNPIFEYILEQNPDIICLQEFSAEKKTTKNGGLSLAEIDERFRDYKFKDFYNSRNNDATVQYGLAIYSKYPILRKEQVHMLSTFNGGIVYELEIKGRKVTLANIHMESNRITSDDKKLYSDFLRKRNDVQLTEVAHNIKDRMSASFTKREFQVGQINKALDLFNNETVVVCGDFNDTPISYVYKNVKGNLVDSFVESGSGLGITYNENMFLFRIDYIFHSENLKAYNFRVGDRKISDHYPVWTTLEFVD